jgi:hypothetical protein
MGKLNLGRIHLLGSAPDYSAGELLRKSRYNNEKREDRRLPGSVTDGYIDVKVTGGIAWTMAGYIKLAYEYMELPNFTYGQDGMYSEDATSFNEFGPMPPQELIDLVEAEDVTTYSPAFLVARVIHWHKKYDTYYTGCYLVIGQLNPDCTETDKWMRLHFRFEGRGV